MKYCLLFLTCFSISIHMISASNPSLKTRSLPSANIPRLSDHGVLVEISLGPHPLDRAEKPARFHNDEEKQTYRRYVKDFISKIPGAHPSTLKEASCLGNLNIGFYTVDLTKEGKTETHFVKFVVTEARMGSYKEMKPSFDLLTNVQRGCEQQYFVIPHTVVTHPHITALVMNKVHGVYLDDAVNQGHITWECSERLISNFRQYMKAKQLVDNDFNWGSPLYDIENRRLRLVDCGDYAHILPSLPAPLDTYFKLFSKEVFDATRRSYTENGLYFDERSAFKALCVQMFQKKDSSTFRSPPTAPTPSIPDKPKEPLLTVTVNPHIPPAGVSQMEHDFNRGIVPLEQMGMDFLLNNNGRVARMGYLDAKEAEWAAAIREAVKKGAPIPPCPPLAEGFYIRSIVVDGTRYTNSSSSTNGSSSGGCSMM